MRGQSEAPDRCPAPRAFQRGLERASQDASVCPVLRGALRALASVRRRSGRDPGEDQLTDGERELRWLLPGVFQGDPRATARAHEIVRGLLLNLP